MAELVLHRVRLASADGFGRAVPLEPFGQLIRSIQLLAAQATVMAFRGSSAKPPKGVGFEAMLDFRLCGQAGDPATGDTLLTFAAPRLGPAAPAIYGQEVIPGLPDLRPSREATGFDLLAATLADLVGGDQDSPRLDPGLLRTVAAMHSAFTPPHRFTALWLESREAHGTPAERSVVSALTLDTCRTAAAWVAAVPEMSSVRLTGRLDMVRISAKSFVLAGDDGTLVPGVFTGGAVDRLAALLGRRITLVGQAVHRPSGRILRLEAQAVTIQDGGEVSLEEDPGHLVVLLEDA